MSKNVMLAHCYDPKKHDGKVAGWWISEKYDGVRGKWNGQQMESRTGKIYTIPDFIRDQLLKIVDEDGNPMELDGEIWFGKDTFTIASGSARRQDNDPELWKQMTYMVFDTPDLEIPFEDRVEKVYSSIRKVKEQVPNIKGVRYVKFDPEETTIEKELQRVESLKGEGIMLRRPGSLYVCTRSHDLLKVKSWIYKEAIVTGYVEGTGKYVGMVGSLMVECENDDDEDESGASEAIRFKVGSGLTDWQRYSGDTEGNWKSKEVQEEIDYERSQLIKTHDRDDKKYKELLEVIKTKGGEEKNDALHSMNTFFMQMPLIGDRIIFRFKEKTKNGIPSMPTFVGVRDYE